MDDRTNDFGVTSMKSRENIGVKQVHYKGSVSTVEL
jgi:hypothetical protein